MGLIKEFFNNLFGKKPENQSQVSQIMPDCGGLNETFLFDFKNFSSGYSNNSGFVLGGISNGVSIDGSSESGTPKVIKLKSKPKYVLNELETVPTPFSLSGLDEKIAMLKYKEKLIVQSYAKREVSALMERLENRKKYVEFKSYFDNFQNTTDEKIDDLLSKHDLVMKTSDIFIPEFPDEAINVMVSYTEKMDELCGKKPVFYVIAEPDKFTKSYEKRDPILLVQSPFGFYWQILGAWDEEMILLSEL